MAENELRINMLGGFSITYGQRPVSFGKRGQSRFIQLLQILWLHPDGVAKDKLIDDLYEWEEISNRNNSLNNLVYRLRKQLVSAGLPEEEYVKVGNGVCSWCGSMPISLDVREMEENLRRAEETGEEDKKIRHLFRAWELYRGELLPQLSNENWVIMESVRLKKLYEGCVRQLGERLKEHREYPMMYRVYSVAAELYPFEEWQAYQMDSLMLMERYEDAMRLYNDTVKRYSDELGLPPSKRMLECFQRMREKLVQTEDCFTEIHDNLTEENREFGAYYCAYPSFIDTYRILCRITERSGHSAFLMSCTLSQLSKKHEKRNSKEVALWLKDAICRSLRCGDICTRYSKNKYLMILMGMNQEDSESIIRRIKNNFSRNPGTVGYQLEFSLASAVDMNNIMANELFRKKPAVQAEVFSEEEDEETEKSLKKDQ